MLKVNNVSKSFGDKQVLSNFTAEFSSDSKTLIAGPSGIGKTTLLRIIAGLERPDCGDVLIGQDESGVISYMFQEPRLFGWMNVLENVTVSNKNADRNRVIEILRMLGLEGELHSRPHELSGGMQRRVALARTLLCPADIYIFDEPFAGLDDNNSKIAADMIFSYTEGKTVIIVSHDNNSLPDDINVIEIKA